MKFQVWHYQTEYALEKLFFWVFYFTLSLSFKMQNRPQENEKKIKALIQQRASAYAHTEAAMQSDYTSA